MDVRPGLVGYRRGGRARDRGTSRHCGGNRTTPDPGDTAMILRDAAALEREWLVTNGLGGFACGTVSQANTRRYHGLLIASLRPPIDRVLIVSKADLTVQYGEQRFELATTE